MSNHLSWKKWLVRVFFVLVLTWLAVAAAIWVTAWKPLTPYDGKHDTITVVEPILNGRQYSALIDSHPRPYLVLVSTETRPGGAVLIYGSEHTNDPNHTSLNAIENSFTEFAPTVVLCEGRMTGLLLPWFMDATKTFGESGFVRGLAYRNDCRVFTWEPSPEVEVDGLLTQGFTVEQVALRKILSSYFSNLRFGKPSDPQSVVAESLRKKRSWPKIGDVFQDIGELNAAWHQHFPNGPAWQDVSDEFGLPGFLGEMDSNLVRDQHLFEAIMDLVNEDERVFVIAGSSHAVKLDAAVTSAIQGR